VQDIVYLRENSNMLVRTSADRLFDAQNRIKTELAILRTRAALLADDSMTPLEWYNKNTTAAEMPFLSLLITLGSITPLGSVQIERNFGEISECCTCNFL